MQLEHQKCSLLGNAGFDTNTFPRNSSSLRARNIAARAICSNLAALLDFGTRTHQREFAQV